MMRLAISTLILSLLASPALAADTNKFTFPIEGFYIIDFVIYVGLLWFFLAGPARKFLVNRHERIKAELETATRLREEAEKRLATLEAMVSGVESEIAAIREQFKADGEREQARILAEAEANAEKVRQNAKKQLEQEMAKLRETLEHELIRNVLEATEAKVKARLDAGTQKQLTANFVDSLEKIERLDRAA
jgi:F-type H+-transporting ATPase subunit b